MLEENVSQGSKCSPCYSSFLLFFFSAFFCFFLRLLLLLLVLVVFILSLSSSTPSPFSYSFPSSFCNFLFSDVSFEELILIISSCLVSTISHQPTLSPCVYHPVPGMAAMASRVRIQQKGHPEMAVESVPNSTLLSAQTWWGRCWGWVLPAVGWKKSERNSFELLSYVFLWTQFFLKKVWLIHNPLQF